MQINIFENGIYLNIEITEDKDVRLLHLGPIEFKPRESSECYKDYRLVEVHESGMNQDAHHGSNERDPTGPQPQPGHVVPESPEACGEVGSQEGGKLDQQRLSLPSS